MSIEATARCRRDTIHCLGYVCYPLAIVKCCCLTTSGCCILLSDTKTPLCAADYTKIFCDNCWDGNTRSSSYLDLACRVINPCVCCVDWKKQNLSNYLLPEDYAPSPPAQQMGVNYPRYFMIPGLGGSS